MNETEKGPITFDADAARAVMADYAARGVELMIDLEHDSLDKPIRQDSHDARGWFKLQLRPDGSLWAVDVRWTPDGARRLAEKTQRYTSPAFFADRDGRVAKLLNVAICAMPATHDARPLVAASRAYLASRNTSDRVVCNTMDPSQVKAALDAIEAGDAAKAIEILKALIATAASGEAPPPSSTDNAPPADPTADSADGAPPPAAGPPGKDDPKATMNSLIASFRSEVASATKVLTALRTEVGALNAEVRASESTKRIELVGELVKLGAETPATAWADPDKHVVCKRLAAEPVADLAKRVEMLRAASVEEPGNEPPAERHADVSTLTERQLEVCRKHNITPEEYIRRTSNAVRRFGQTTEIE